MSSWSPLHAPRDLAPLSRLPNKLLLRSLLLSSLMTSKIFLRPSLALLNALASSKSAFLNPDKNPLLNRLVRWTLYNHFCPGTNRAEVVRTVNEIKNMGYQGVILGYSKEVVLDHSESKSNKQDTHETSSTAKDHYPPQYYEVIEEWKRGTLETLRMIGPGDFLALKLTGAGPISLEAMQARGPIPEAVSKALDEICTETAKQGSRLWLDAEQQLLQPGLDNWAIELMRRYNTPPTTTTSNSSGAPLIYNTIQAYLKGSRANVQRHLDEAEKGGFLLGVKLVRGAYIEHEVRGLIHDSKTETDESYNGIAEMLICRRRQIPRSDGEDVDVPVPVPAAALFLATHNAESADRAIRLYQGRLESGLPTVSVLECGQIMGMADELSCELVQRYETAAVEGRIGAPRTFKCMHWGTVSECMEYLHRRAIENRGAVERTHHMRAALAREFRRRIGL
ncbi:hypothetical protein ASPSYDRAFT_82563 [Aspergillus sydowii CBS 593.65]|uniref:Proline dehydrogenase n=1 Tax=Aspergillus sydowii CBS 593.65 TaxID=1036612 RepID=A0A1L9T0T9_9EURO|nr:uncharacterized protein ASPSYDRAFT_82563 [Aspergillus sydowii CBS 593.65]OJJ53082.1 hypothetical protein ASPSYDRAFT_82563 [Aspergillus sydowii CBS 593.65]